MKETDLEQSPFLHFEKTIKNVKIKKFKKNEKNVYFKPCFLSPLRAPADVDFWKGKTELSQLGKL